MYTFRKLIELTRLLSDVYTWAGYPLGAKYPVSVWDQIYCSIIVPKINKVTVLWYFILLKDKVRLWLNTCPFSYDFLSCRVPIKYLCRVFFFVFCYVKVSKGSKLLLRIISFFRRPKIGRKYREKRFLPKYTDVIPQKSLENKIC